MGSDSRGLELPAWIRTRVSAPLEEILPRYAAAMKQALFEGRLDDLARMLDLLAALGGSPAEPPAEHPPEEHSQGKPDIGTEAAVERLTDVRGHDDEGPSDDETERTEEDHRSELPFAGGVVLEIVDRLGEEEEEEGSDDENEKGLHETDRGCQP